jgi:hypothetical protein
MSFDFKFTTTRLNIYDTKLRTELNTSSGDMWKWFERKLKPLMLSDARRMVGVRTGALRQNIRWYHLGNFTGQYFGLRADLPYALLHHEGSKPHQIFAKNPGGVLVFAGRNKTIVHTPSVNHPGTRPNPYLSRTLVHVRRM